MPKVYVQSNMPAFATECYHADHTRHCCKLHGNCLHSLRIHRCEFWADWEALTERKRGRPEKKLQGMKEDARGIAKR